MPSYQSVFRSPECSLADPALTDLNEILDCCSADPAGNVPEFRETINSAASGESLS